MSDERIVCVVCGEPFIWSYGEQRFYREQNLSRPKRCPNCRPSHSQKSTGSWWPTQQPAASQTWMRWIVVLGAGIILLIGLAVLLWLFF